MNTAKQMIIVKNEIKTKDIQSCKYNPDNSKWDIVYYNSCKVFSYAFSNVIYLTNPIILNPNMYRISRAGKVFFNIHAIYVFRKDSRAYWHICFLDGSERDYSQEDLIINESCLTDNESKNVFIYLSQIAKVSELVNENTGENILAKRYEKIDYIDNKTSLVPYLNPNRGQIARRRESIPIFPFGCNKSKYQAVKNALENQISVIQGPPGTGKTQTILNIIANILMRGQTVQIVSNNNAAIDNVYEKLASPQYNLSFIAASLGNAENKKTFISNQKSCYPDLSSWIMQEQDKISLDEIKSRSLQLQQYFEKQEKLASLKQELSQLELEIKYFDEYQKESEASLELRIKKQIDSEKLMALWQDFQTFADNSRKPGILFRLKNILLYGIGDWNFYNQNLTEIINALQKLFLGCRQDELKKEISQLTEEMHSVNRDLTEEMCSQSMRILKDVLARKYENGKERQIFSEVDLWKNPQAVLSEYPVVLSTTFSSRSSLNENVVYDYLIMDEASQVDVATGALALSCAKNAIIVGDTKQLPNVVPNEAKQQADAVFQNFHIGEGYRFSKSFLQSILEVLPNVTQVLLREHYRCHPKIINFCNQKFYGGELIIMTEDKGEKDVLAAVKTKKGNHVREHYSQRQIDVIKNEVIPVLNTEPNKIGIITPYKKQVSALQTDIAGIEIATVHKFQGREKDTVIISTVDDEISDFVDDPYLLNVAVSRAKRKLILVVSGNEQSPERNICDLIAYIRYNNFEVQESNIFSIFDYLYKQYTEARRVYLLKHKKISVYDSENLMYALITDIFKEKACSGLDVVCHTPLRMLLKNLSLLNDRECEYAMNPATHLDFLIFNRISKQPVLVVEVDGYDFHNEGTVQASRDGLKDRILEMYGIPMVRFRTNGSREREILIDKLKDYAVC